MYTHPFVSLLPVHDMKEVGAYSMLMRVKWWCDSFVRLCICSRLIKMYSTFYCNSPVKPPTPPKKDVILHYCMAVCVDVLVYCAKA